MEQRPGESIKAFLARFNAAAAKVADPEPRLVLMALKGAIIKKSKFGKWLKMKKPKTLERFYAKAEEYIDVEDDPSYAMDIAEGSKDPSKKENDVPNSQKNSGGQKRGNDAKDNQNNKKLRFSKIQNPLENVFLAAKDTKDYPQPKPLKVNDSNISSGRFCRFHNQPGHNTNECRHLKSLVEE